MFATRYFYTYFSISLIAIQSTWWIWWLFRNHLPPQVPFNFMRPWGLEQLVPTVQLWYLPLFGSISLLLSLALAWWLWRIERFYAQLLLSSLMFLSIIVLLSMLRVVFLFA
jgi:hypothetical protein